MRKRSCGAQGGALLVLLAGAVWPASSHAGFEPANAYYVELLGAAPYSINVERRQWQSLTLRMGVTAVPSLFGSGNAVAAPLGVYGLLGEHNHLFEFGGGPTPGFRSGNASQRALMLGHATIGYRYQPTDGGFFFRCVGGGLARFHPKPVDGFPTVGLSFGYTH